MHLYKNTILDGSPSALEFRLPGLGISDFRPQLAEDLIAEDLLQFRSNILGNRVINDFTTTNSHTASIIECCYNTRKRLIYPWSEIGPSFALSSSSPEPRLPSGGNVLVTGARGFIGGRLVERLVEGQRGNIRAFLRNRGDSGRVSRLPVELSRGDLTNFDDVDRAVSGVEYVFHCAFDNKSRDQNVYGLRNLLMACGKHSVRRLIHLSTFAVYEPFPDGELTECTREGDRSNTYVDTKLTLEKIILELSGNYGVSTTIIQPAIVYGPYCKPWTDTPAENLIFREVILPGRGEGLCNAVYIDDLVDGLVLATNSSMAIGERFILSGPNPVTWASFFDAIAVALGTRLPAYWRPEEIVNDRQTVLSRLRPKALDYRHLIRVIAGERAGRDVLRTILDAMPATLRKIALIHYLGADGHQAGGRLLPSNRLVEFYELKATAGCQKARRLLGYSPRFDFQTGMQLTAKYLAWAYGDIAGEGPGGSKKL